MFFPTSGNIYIYKYLQINIFYIYIYAYSSPFILLRLNLGAFGGMVVWALCVIVADCGFTCQKRVCEKPFLTLAISAPLYININIIIRIKTYSFLSITFIPKISPSRYKLMEFWYAFFWPKNRKINIEMKSKQCTGLYLFVDTCTPDIKPSVYSPSPTEYKPTKMVLGKIRVNRGYLSIYLSVYLSIYLSIYHILYIQYINIYFYLIFSLGISVLLTQITGGLVG